MLYLKEAGSKEQNSKERWSMRLFAGSGKGLGSFVGGQLSRLPMGLTGVFASTSIFMGSAGLGVLIVYLIWGRGWERAVVAEKQVILDGMENRRRRSSSSEIKREEEDLSAGEEFSTKL